MKANRNYPIAVITEKAERSLRNGHVWVYSEEITETVGHYENGDLVDVVSFLFPSIGRNFLQNHLSGKHYL